MATTPDTNKPTARRTVSYPSIDAAVQDAARLVAAGAETTGDWSLGEILQHLANTFNASVDGFGFTVSLPIRVLGRLVFKRKIFNTGMNPGIKLPPSAAAVLAPEPIDADEALANLQASAVRFNAATEFPPHPIFGRMSVDENHLLQRRHSELHLSFIQEPADG